MFHFNHRRKNMGKPRIKKNYFKEMVKILKRISRELWNEQFSPDFNGPNQGASCEDCSFHKSGECLGGITPEICIESATSRVLREVFEEKYGLKNG